MGRTFDTGYLRNIIAYDASGNVGLGGAVDATYKLKVTGAMQVTGALSGTSATFSGIINANSVATAANGSINIDNSDPTLRFRRAGGTANSSIYEFRAIAAGGVNDVMQLRLWNDAQTVATTLMTVSSTGAATFSSSVTIGAGTALNFGARGGISQDGSWNFTWGTNSVANAFYLQSSTGNVGIGTSSPVASLHIIRALGSDVIAIGESGNNTRFSIGQEASYTGNYINSTNIDLKLQAYFAGGSGGNIIFQTGASGAGSLAERIRITGGGYLWLVQILY